jgi:surface protein
MFLGSNISYGGALSIPGVMSIWNTAKVTDMSAIFRHCKNINVFANGDTDHLPEPTDLYINLTPATNLSFAFANSSINQFICGDVASYNATSTASMFENCRNLNFVSRMVLNNTSNMISMFKDCINLPRVAINIPKVTTAYQAFYNCPELKTIYIYESDKITNAMRMFFNCRHFTEPPYLKTNSVTVADSMFVNCTNLYRTTFTEPADDYNTSNLISMNYMFQNCTNLVIISELNTAKVTYMRQAFAYCNNLSADSIDRIINMCLNAVNMASTEKTLLTTSTRSPFYKTNITNSRYTNRLSELSAAGWTY